MNKFARIGSFTRKAGLAAVAALGTSLAMAQTAAQVYDPSANVAAINGTIPGLLSVGGAVFLVFLAIRSTKWGRKVL